MPSWRIHLFYSDSIYLDLIIPPPIPLDSSPGPPFVPLPPQLDPRNVTADEGARPAVAQRRRQTFTRPWPPPQCRPHRHGSNRLRHPRGSPASSSCCATPTPPSTPSPSPCRSACCATPASPPALRRHPGASVSRRLRCWRIVIGDGGDRALVVLPSPKEKASCF